MGLTFYFDWEVQLIQWLQAILPDTVIHFFSLISFLGEDLGIIGVLGFSYWCIDKKKSEIIACNTILISSLFSMTKNVIFRRRPYFDHEGIKILKPVDADADVMDITAQGYSFPSGHSASAAGLYASIMNVYRKKWFPAICLTLIFLIGVSRFVLGAHYPTDVLAGWVLGFAVAFLLPKVRKKINNDRTFRFILFLTVIPGIFFCRTSDYFTSLGLLTGFYLALYFESKYIKFKKPERFIYYVLRPLGGIILFLLMNYLLKLPFSAEFLNSGTAFAFAVRSIRYAFLVFVDMGIYPFLFRYEK